MRELNCMLFIRKNVKYDVYIPVIYKNVRSKNGSVAFSLDDPEVVDTEYHFNEGGYTYGYGDLDSLYNDVVKHYERRYTIVEK